MRSREFLISWGMGFFVLGAVVTGCDRNTDQEVVSSPSSSPQCSCIAPGVGFGVFEIGASAEALKRVKPPTSIEEMSLRPGEYLIYEDEGVDLNSENGRIVLVDIEVSHATGVRRTCDGIDSGSTVRDVIMTYGQPTTLSNLTVYRDEDAPPKQQVRLSYYEKGITFTFLDGRLKWITVDKPMKEGEYDPFWTRDTGDVSEYRSMEVPSDAAGNRDDKSE